MGAEHKFDLFLKDRILMFLMYCRAHTTYDVPSMISDLDKLNVDRDISYLEHAVKQTTPHSCQNICRFKKKINGIYLGA